MNQLIKANRSLIISADLPSYNEVGKLAFDLKGLPIGAYKIGFVAGLKSGLERVCEVLRLHIGDETPIIYDHQKAGTDIPEMGKLFAKVLADAGVNAAILFPQAGPKTAEAWIKACQDRGLHVMVGLAMTHANFFASEGGYIADDAPARVFALACRLGVRDFVVPGTKPDIVTELRKVLGCEVSEGNYTLYAPGFISQGGSLTKCGQVAGPNFHAIVGSAIYSEPTREGRRRIAEHVIRGLA